MHMVQPQLQIKQQSQHKELQMKQRQVLKIKQARMRLQQMLQVLCPLQINQNLMN
jgi:hypothetical protein